MSARVGNSFGYRVILLLSIALPSVAQSVSPDPCGIVGAVVYDANQGVCWLADANLAGDPKIVARMGVTGINPNGSMDYQTALNWVAALNAFNNGVGFRGRNNWQLPVTPLADPTCGDTGPNSASFGPLCTGSAMGNLYYMGLHQTFPNSVAAGFAATIGPIHNIKLSYYWALQNNGSNTGGQETFSFANGQHGGTTTKDSFYYVLPMVAAALSGAPSCSTGSPSVLAYTQGLFAGKAVFDCKTGITWLADANLAASNNFGIQGGINLTYGSRTITVPAIEGGAMLFETATQWIQALNSNPSYNLGSLAWNMPPTYDELQQLFADLNLTPGDTRLLQRGAAGPFQNLQPFFYWACERNPSGNSQSACNGSTAPETLQFTFDFDYGFETTSALDQKYFVMVYYPAPAPVCTTPSACCVSCSVTSGSRTSR